MRPRWLEAADASVGVAEVPGAGSNPVIMAWAKDEGGWIESFYKDDDIAWCALFACHCLHVAGFKDPRTLAAADFLRWGQPVVAPALGAVVVLKRPGGHHVGFYLGQDAAGRLRLRGGNQGNKVGDAWFDPARVLGWRWPSELPVPEPQPVLLASTGEPVSTNEG